MGMYIGDRKVNVNVCDPDKVYSWTPPSNWPNIKEILANDTEPYEYKIIILLRADYPTRAYPYSNDKNDNYITSMSNIQKFKASDDLTMSDPVSGGALHMWDKTKDIDTGAEFKFRWIIFYSNNKPGNASVSASNQCYYPGVLWIHGTSNLSPSMSARFANKLRAVTFNSLSYTTGGASYAFECCYDLEFVPHSIQTSTVTNFMNMFASCYALKHAPTLDFSAATTTAGMYYKCTNLLELQDEFDIPNATTTGSMFYMCSKIQHGPKRFNAPKATTINHMFSECRSLKDVPSLNAPSTTRYDSVFQNCYALESVTDEVFNFDNVTTTANMFNGCYQLKTIPSAVDLSHVSNCQGMFNWCTSIVNFPDVIDLRSCTSANNISNFMNGQRNNAMKMPTHLYLPAYNFSITEWLSAPFFDKSSFASFDENGEVNGGLVHNLNSISSAATLTIYNGFKIRFTTEEQQKIAQCLTSKGWTLSW